MPDERDVQAADGGKQLRSLALAVRWGKDCFGNGSRRPGRMKAKSQSVILSWQPQWPQLLAFPLSEAHRGTAVPCLS